MTRLLGVVLLASLAAACSASPPQATILCPTVLELTSAQQRALADELRAKDIAEGDPLDRMEADWQRMRDEARACARGR